MNTKNYIKIPTIGSLKVRNYPLFHYPKKEEDYWVFQIIDGINLMLGANAIGKTTTMNLIKFAFIGNQQKINTTYFNKRIKKTPKEIPNQYIILIFCLNGKEIEIHRNLISGQLDHFIVDGNKQDTVNYPNFFQDHSKISLYDFADLLDLMLIREEGEDGNYILWNNEAQTKIIATLLNSVAFQKQLLEDESNYEKLEREFKQLKKLINEKKEQEHKLKELIEKEKKKKNEATSIAEKQRELEKLKHEKLLVDQNIIRLQQALNKKTGDLNAIYQNVERKRKDYVNISKNTEHLEANINYLKGKLEHFRTDSNCILCTTKISQEKASQIHMQYFFDKVCPVCESSLGEPIIENDPKLIEEKLRLAQLELEKVNIKLEKAKKVYEEAKNKQNDIKKNISELRKLIDTEETKQHHLATKILAVEREIDNLKQQNPNQPTNYDIELLKLREEIEALKKEQEKIKHKKTKSALTLSKQRQLYNETIKKFVHKLNVIFRRYSKEYFNNNCELTPHLSKTKKEVIQIKSFVPKFKDKICTQKRMVSHSEAIFLEYLFRVALLELYHDETDTKPFLFLETSEGSFDVANTASAATLFSKFAAKKFPVILVANFSKEDFINALFADRIDREKRTFNLIKYGKLSKRQQEDKQLKLFCD